MRRAFVVLWIMAAVILPAQVRQQGQTTRPAVRKKAPAKPAPKTETPDRWPLGSISVAGNRVFPADAIVRATGLQPGVTVGKADFERALQRLTDAGAFETISFRYTPEAGNIAVVFEVQEVIDLYPVGFERLDVPDEELKKVLGQKVPLFGPQVPATGAMVKRITAALEVYLAEKGKGTQVVGRLLSISGGQLAMTFRPEAAPPVVTFVKFENSTLIRAEELQRAFYQVAVGLPYTEKRIQELLDSNIRPLFEEKARLQVRFGPLRTEESKDATGVTVTVPVEEGEEFQFGGVKFAGNAHVPEKDLSRMVRLEEGELANMALVKKAVGEIERRYQRDGYMKVNITVERALDEKKKTADLTIRIRAGDQYTLRTISIKGLDIIAEDAVRKRWAIQRGQPFDGAYPDVFLKRIEEEAMFERLGKTSWRMQVDEEAKAVDVELQFQGARPAPAGTRRRRGP